jgi:hypothetical protein
MHMDSLAAKDTEGTWLGKSADWVCDLHIAYDRPGLGADADADVHALGRGPRHEGERG